MKRICLAGYNVELLTELLKQMRCYFEDQLDYCIWDYNQVDVFTKEGMIIVFSDVEYNHAIRHCSSNAKVILGKLALTKEAYGFISKLALKGDLYFAHETPVLARGYLRHLNAFNFGCVIEVLKKEDSFEGKTIIIQDSVYKSGVMGSSHVNVFEDFLMDRSTLIQIGFAMDLDDLIYPQDLLNKYKPCCSSDWVLSEMIHRNNQFRSELGMVNQVMDDAVIAVDIHGVVQIYSKRAQGLFKYPVDDAVGEKNIECFEVIGFEHVLSTKNPIKDRLIEVGGMNLIVTVNPIYHGKKLYGAIAMIREFQEEEIKQHSFRKQIMDKGHRSKYRFEDLIGKSRVLTELKEVAERMSKSDSSVLIYGESGTGKELIAQAMHFTSHRSHYQFVALNCGALPESLLESELFGYEEGAFTGARKGGKQGLFELAHQGTLFLDEIGEMPMNTQLRLLRVLQEREVMRIGGDRLIKIDVRIIAASNKMLKRLVAEGKFREDLYYRLCVLPLKIPSLKERREDVDALIHHFKLKNDTDFEFSEGAKRCLELYHWPGNIRELRNYVEYWKNLNKPVVAELDLPFYEDFELNSVEGHKEEGFQRYLEHVHHPVEMSITVLDILRTHKMNDQRIGRKGIYKKVNELGRVLSEHEVRFILLQMESFDYVKICRGRGGTVITPLGAQALDCFKQSRLTCG